MTRRGSRKIPPGLYRIMWKDCVGGGSSLAAIGMLQNGDRWLAPINWVYPATMQDSWRDILAVVAIGPEDIGIHSGDMYDR